MKSFFCFWWKVTLVTFRASVSGDEVAGFIDKLVSTLAWALVLTTALGLARKDWVGPALPWVTAVGVFFLFFIYSPYTLWASNQDAVEKLNEKLKSKLKCSFSMQSAGCVVWSRLFHVAAGQQIPAGEARFFRIKVEVDGVPRVSSCGGTLLKLTRDGVVLFEQESLGLHMAHADSSSPRNKDVMDQIPEHVDVFMITKENRIVIATPGFAHPASIHHETLFTGSGTYGFHVVVSSPDCTSVPVNIQLKWTGDADSAVAEQVANA